MLFIKIIYWNHANDLLIGL